VTRAGSLRVVSANVNGIRAAARRGGLAWLAAQRADVLCLQEVRASEAQLRDVLAEGGLGDWHLLHAEASERGRAGVAVLSRGPLLRTCTTCGPEEFDGQGRWAEADVLTPAGLLTVVSAYVHTGEAGTERQDLKYRFLDAIADRVAAWGADGRLAVIACDLNIAHREDDLKNWRGNLARAGFLPRERAYLDRWLEYGQWSDVHRELHGPGPGPYTWWSWRGKAFDNDAGWRIDYQLATRPLAKAAVRASVGRAAAYAQRWSDHAAIVVDYDLGGDPAG
jgi:exodeoxyribonuclease-3